MNILHEEEFFSGPKKSEIEIKTLRVKKNKKFQANWMLLQIDIESSIYFKLDLSKSIEIYH